MFICSQKGYHIVRLAHISYRIENVCSTTLQGLGHNYLDMEFSLKDICFEHIIRKALMNV